VLKSHHLCEQKKPPTLQVGGSISRQAEGDWWGAPNLLPSPATNTLYHTVTVSTSAKLPIRSPAILRGCDLHRQMNLNLRPVARFGLEAQPAAGQLRALAHSQQAIMPGFSQLARTVGDSKACAIVVNRHSHLAL